MQTTEKDTGRTQWLRYPQGLCKESSSADNGAC